METEKRTGRPPGGNSLARAVIAACAALLLAGTSLAGIASGASPTRAEYVSRLETICQPRVEATERVMKGVRADVRAERLRVAAAKFAKGTKLFSETVTEMAPVTRPEADLAKLRKWFGLLRQEESWLRRITAALRAQQANRAQRDTAHFIHSGNLANNVVIAFGFNYCSFRFSRFG